MARGEVWLEWKRSRLNYNLSGDRRDTGLAGSIFANSAEAEAAHARVKLDVRKPGGREAIGNVRAIDRNEDAADVNEAM